MVMIYTIAWNEILMLPHFVAHYRTMFPRCRIIVYSNESDDGTDDIARALGCEVKVFKTGGTISDRTYLEIKNNCWLESEAWVLIADVDEFLIINEDQLKEQEKKGVTLIRGEGYNMIGEKEKVLPPHEITRGVRAPSYDKIYLFDSRAISGINYLYGCHRANPIGRRQFNNDIFKCKHYKYLGLEYMIKRHATFEKRLSEHNRKFGLGIHYAYTPEEITKEFNEARKNAIVV